MQCNPVDESYQQWMSKSTDNSLIQHRRQCFASQCKPRKKTWISEQSLQLVRQKRGAVRVWTHLRRRWRWSMLEKVFDVWKAVKNGKIPTFILQMHQARMCAMRNIITQIFVCDVTRSTNAECQHNDMMLWTNVHNGLRP